MGILSGTDKVSDSKFLEDQLEKFVEDAMRSVHSLMKRYNHNRMDLMENSYAIAIEDQVDEDAEPKRIEVVQYDPHEDEVTFIVHDPNEVEDPNVIVELDLMHRMPVGCIPDLVKAVEVTFQET